MFKRILFNPITIGLIIGGLWLVFGKWIFSWLSSGVKGIIGAIVPMIVSLAKMAGKLLKGAWDVISWSASKIAGIVNWITNPSGSIASAVVGVFKFIFFIKDYIGDMMKAAGKESLDVFCMFLSGDWIGIAESFTAGLCVKFWKWLTNLKVFRVYIAMLKSFGQAFMLITSLPHVYADAIMKAA